MNTFTIATFNVKNLIGPEKEYYRFQSYTAEEYAWKKDWLADQLLTMNSDIIGFQEIFEEDALRDVVQEANARGNTLNSATIPSREKSYHRKAIFSKLKYHSYDENAVFFAPNLNDGEPGHRRPGLALLSRFGFLGTPEIIQELDTPFEIEFPDFGEDIIGSYKIKRLSRPIIKAKIPVGNHVLTVFNCHLKSKLGEFITPKGADYAPEADLTAYDAKGRALGALRSALRRMAEAWVLRSYILDALKEEGPVIVLGDYNDGEHAVSSEIIAGESPFKNYSWMLRHNAENDSDRYSKEEHEKITTAINQVKLISAEKLFVKKSLRDMIYTSAFGGVYESIDQILLSHHFNPDAHNPIGEMEYLSVYNDHITDGAHREAPYNKLASDHGQLVAHLKFSN